MTDYPEPESYYRDMLAKQVNGRTEVVLPFGRADVMTDTMVWEVEPISRWRHGTVQALQYAGQCVQQGALALYGSPLALQDAYSALSALPSPGLELWWLTDSGFVHIRSRVEILDHLPESEQPPTPPSKSPVSLLPQPAPKPAPCQQYNSRGFEVWGSPYLENGELRPECRGLDLTDMEVFAKIITEHAPDLTSEAKQRLALLLGSSG